MKTRVSRHLVLVEAYRLTEEDKGADLPPSFFNIYGGEYDVRLTPIGTGRDHLRTPIDFDIESAGQDYILEDTWEDVKKMLPEVKPGEWARVLTVWEFIAEKRSAGDFGGGPWEYETYEYPIGKINIKDILSLLEEKK